MERKKKRTALRVMGFLLLGIYVAVALLNTSVVQSCLGAVAGHYFSKEWGGKVRVGALHASPLSHLVLEKIELISPSQDTIFVGDRVACRFSALIPYKDGQLKLDRLALRNCRYHFESVRHADSTHGTNLDYIIKYYASESPMPPSEGGHFVVSVDELRLRNVDYIQDLPEPLGMTTYPHGVSIPHMRYYGTSGHFRRVRVENDSITCRIVSLSTTEASGLHVVDLSSDIVVSPHIIRATNLDLQTDSSRVFLDAQLTYHGWKGMADYCHTVRHNVVLKEGTEVNLSDAAYWAPALWGLGVKVAVKGHAYGSIDGLRADNLYVTFGESSRALVNGSVRGLPDIRRTVFDVMLHRLHTNYEDLAAVRFPDSAEWKMPQLVRQMAVIDLDAQLKGSANDWEAFANLNSMIGDVEAQASVRYDSVLRDYAYVGTVDSRTVGLRSFLPNEWVSRTGFHLSFQGTSVDLKKMEASLEGRLYDTHFKGNTLARTTLSAEISQQVVSADVGIKDSLVELDFEASVDLRNSTVVADLLIDHLQASRLHLVKADSNIELATHLVGRVRGTSLDDLSGNLSLDGSHLAFGSRGIGLNHLDMAVSNEQGYKSVAVNSDWLNATLNGYFRYEDLPLVVRDFCEKYVPTYYNPYKDADTVDLTPLAYDNFDFEVAWTDSLNALEELLPGFSLSPGTSVHGNYNYAESLKAVFRSHRLSYNNLAIEDVGLNSSKMGNNYQLTLNAGGVSLGSTGLANSMNLRAILGGSISTLRMKWGDGGAKQLSEGDLEFFLNSTETDNRLMITKPTLYVAGQPWTLICPDGVRMNNDRLQVEGLRVYGLGQSMAVSVLMEGEETDYVMASFSDFVLDNLVSLLMPNSPLQLEGRVNGDFRMRGLAENPYLDADLTVGNCVLNGQEIGEVGIRSNYAAQESKVYVELQAERSTENGVHHPFEASGTIALGGRSPSLDFAVKMEEVPLEVVQPFVDNFASGIGGTVNALLDVGGTLNTPQIGGTLSLQKAFLQIAPTGVTYYVNNECQIVNDTLLFSDFLVRDNMQNQLEVNGSVAYAEGGLSVDLDVNTPRLLVLDKEPAAESKFYGRLLVSANGHVGGTLDAISVNAVASTLQGSEIYVPIDNSKEVSESNEFITFVSHDPVRRPPTTSAPRNEGSPVDILLNLTVTPGMSLHLPMDFDQLGMNVNAVGQGTMQMSMRGNEPPNILGDYEFTSGSFSLSLMQLISRNFNIEEGSTINFPGDINEVRFDINAVYNLRTNLASLMNNSVSTITNDSYVQVQDVVTLSGTLLDPTIKFDIRLPNAEQGVVDQVFSYIDKNDELEMLNQSISLLLLGSFSSAGTGGASAEGSGFNSLSMITNTASSLLSSMIKFVDVDIKYQAATANSQGQIDVGISKQWNNLYFESTFGYSNSDVQLEQTSTLVGDVEIGYKFNPYFNFYGFHRTNTSYYTRTELPYKQGLGVKLSKDFNTFYDLFPWLRRRKNAVQTE